MDMTPGKYMELLNNLLSEKKAVLLDILALTEAQSDAITEDGMDRLDGLNKGKQLKIDEIDKLDEEFEANCEKLKASLGISRLDQLDTAKLGDDAIKDAKQLKSQTAEILDVIRNISEMEKDNSLKSKRLLDHFGSEIKKINQGKKANNAYKPEPYNVPSYFLDKKK